MSSPIDDFLSEVGSSTATAERLESIGLGLSLFGTVLALGVLVFVLVVHRGTTRELTRLLQVVLAGGVLMVVGGTIEAIGTARLVDAGWWDTLVDGSAPAAMLRTFGGLLVVFGLAVEPRPASDGAVGTERWNPVIGHAFTINGVVFGVVSFSFDGHTVTEGPRLAQAALDVAHVTAGGIWFGGVMALALLAVMRSGGVSVMFVRFASIAMVALAAVAVAGAVMALLIVDGPGDLTGTPWGRRYLLKLGLVAVAAVIGGYHHFRVVPRLLVDGATAGVAAPYLRRTLVVEAVVLTAVVAVTVMLVRASTS